MATTPETGSSTGVDSGLSQVLDLVTSSMLYFVAAIGVAEIVLAGVLELAVQNGYLGRTLWGLWAAVFTVWGAGLIVVGLGGRALIWLKRQ